MPELEQLGIDEAALAQLVAANPEVLKSLQASGLTDLGTATGADALTLPSLDNEVQMVVTNDRNQLKGLQKVRHEKVGNLAHTYPVQPRTGGTDIGLGFGPEADLPPVNDFAVYRQMRQLKFVSTIAQTFVSAQISKTPNFPGSGNNGMHAHNLVSTMLQLLTQVENGFWHGNSAVCEYQPDSIIKQIEDFNVQNLPLNGQRPIYDAQGAKLVELAGSNNKLKLLEEAALIAHDNGAMPTGLVYSAVLAQQMNDYIEDRIRFVGNAESGVAVSQIPKLYPTPFGFGLAITPGSNTLSGPARFLQPKKKVVVSPSSKTRPAAPTIKSATAAAAAAGNTSKFKSGDAGAYNYEVHGVSASGEIGPGTKLSSAKAIAAGQQLTLILTPAGSGSAKTAGFLIARSEKGKTDTKEMIRVPAASSGDTTFVDLNHERPGTAYALLTSPEYARHLFLGINPGRSLMSGAKVDGGSEAMVIMMELARVNASIRHLMCSFYSPDLMVPYTWVLIKNIGV